MSMYLLRLYHLLSLYYLKIIFYNIIDMIYIFNLIYMYIFHFFKKKILNLQPDRLIHRLNQ